MYQWKITIEAWPFSTVPQELAGERSRDYRVRAGDMPGALRMAQAISTGISSNPAVWQAPITAIVKERD